MNDEIKKKLKIKIAISKLKEEENNIVNKKEKFIFKNIGIVASLLIILTGAVFAGGKVIEDTRIWKTPEKVENVTDKITEESKKENITEEEAKEIAIKKLKQIGLNTNIIKVDHYKERESNGIMYIFITKDKYGISIKGKTGEVYDIWNENGDNQDLNTEITEKEAIKVANKYYKLLGFKDGEYEITKIYSNNNEGSGKGPGFKIDITYTKKYGDTYNPYEAIFIDIESKYKNFDIIRVENIPFDNNGIIVTEDEAIQIALKEDEKIKTNEIINTKAKKMVVKMNANAYDRINHTEEYYKSRESSDYPENVYKIEDKVRNAWVVVITYKSKDKYWKESYSYFVDCTTGEIIGGFGDDYIWMESERD